MSNTPFRQRPADEKALIGGILAVSLAIVAAAERDLGLRSDAELRGSRALWRLACLNVVGALAYFAGGAGATATPTATATAARNPARSAQHGDLGRVADGTALHDGAADGDPGVRLERLGGDHPEVRLARDPAPAEHPAGGERLA